VARGRYVYAARVGRHILTAELLSVGRELTVGETRDTNAGELARTLTERGVHVRRIQAVPDELGTVRDAFADALAHADLVVSTGGLGPTPDDLTREAIAELCGETPIVDAGLEAWLRQLWARRNLPFPEMNLKQAWLIPSASAIPNPNGTAPGWWVDRPDGGVVVALPGPPREMRPMWHDGVLRRLAERGLGRESVVRTLRTHGIGESQAADRLGEAVLRAANPEVATYARHDAVDVRISAVAADGRTADELADEAERHVLAQLGEFVWARGAATWAEAVEAALGARGWRLATSEAETGGSLAALFGGMPGLARAEVLEVSPDGSVEDDAEATRAAAGVEVGVALRMLSRGSDTAVSVAVASPAGVHRERRIVFMGGEIGRGRAALAAADILLKQLRQPEGDR
jgi:nicotinamide-nucleotide amidase